jgi:hypothetical protein
MSIEKLDHHRTYRSKLSEDPIHSAVKNLSLTGQEQTQFVSEDVLFLSYKDMQVPVLKIYLAPENGSGSYDVEG